MDHGRLIRGVWLASSLCCAMLWPTGTLLAATFSEFVDPNPTAGNQFGATVVALSTGNVVITSPGDDAGATDAGAVYLFNGATGALISTLRGSTASDGVGSGGVTALSNGNFVVRSSGWRNGAVLGAGAVTWGNGTTGVSGVVSAANSLVGSSTNDQIGGSGVTALSNGNYVVNSQVWNNGAVADVGAVTWGSGATGVSGVVSAANSLIGSTTSDQVGSGGVKALSNGNYVVRTTNWDNGAIVNAGAATWGSGTTGVIGAVSAANSLVGSTASDFVGTVTALSNGNYVVNSPTWDNGAVVNAGAATWGNGTTGVTGTISVANSLVGPTAGDNVGSFVTALSNGNYVVRSPDWDSGAVVNAGAATWGNGATGTIGVVSAANSLVGSTANDAVAIGGVLALSNGNYVVNSANWDNGAVVNVGAATWGSGTTGVIGAVSAGNSLIGSAANDAVANGSARALSNGNYVVLSSSWDNGGGVDAGAATWGSGTTGVTGVVSAANSLVGTTASDNVGNNVTALSNGNYVVVSYFWDNDATADAGAATWGSGTTGVTGAVSGANSLVGTTASDNVGTNVTALSNGNYVVATLNWDNAAVVDAGAVTWGSGTTGLTGVVSAANSLVGSTASDNVGTFVTALSNGSYVVRSYTWDNGAVADVGAVTWGSGTTGVAGVVSAANSLVGSTAGDVVGNQGVTALSNGNYVVVSYSWHNGALANAGAATWGSGLTGVRGAVSAANSLVGAAANTTLLSVVVADDVNHTYSCLFLAEGGGRVRVGKQEPDSPAILSIVDVRNDQGRQVRLSFARSGLDVLNAAPPITGYYVYRREAIALSSARPAVAPTYGAVPAQVLLAGWDYVMTLPATTDPVYQTVVPTLADSNESGFHRAVLFVRAATATAGIYYDSAPDSGWSADNLPPAPPAPFLAAYASGATHLHWGANDEPDLWYYAVYRGNSAAFVPGPSNRIATSSDTGYADAGPAGSYYKLSAVDLNGNESGFALVTPGQTTGVGGERPVVFALEGVRPNPASGNGLHVVFALPNAAPARLELLDVSGRRVLARDVASLGPGRHTVNLADGRTVAPGLYWVRLTQGANDRTKRVAVIQ